MSNRRSSSRADAPVPARRGPWPWLLAAGPAIVVVASLATAWIAVRSDDGLVSQNYYKLGLMVNRTIAASPPAGPDPGATIDIARGGEVRVRLEHPQSAPARLRLTLRRPGEREGAHPLQLRRIDDDDWVGMLPDTTPGRRIVTLESEAWRMPVTVVERLPAQIRLGAADSHS